MEAISVQAIEILLENQDLSEKQYQHPFGRIVEGLPVEFTVSKKGYWAFTVITPEYYVGGKTIQGRHVIQSRHKYEYASMAVSRARTAIELYHMNKSCD